jgi:hypothetical protein
MRFFWGIFADPALKQGGKQELFAEDLILMCMSV